MQRERWERRGVPVYKVRLAVPAHKEILGPQGLVAGLVPLEE